jgi:hypothetical protein
MEATTKLLIKVGSSLLDGRLKIVGRRDLQRGDGRGVLRQYTVRWALCGHSRNVPVRQLANYTECARCRAQQASRFLYTETERLAALEQYRKYLLCCSRLGTPRIQPLEDYIREAIEVMRMEYGAPVAAHDDSIYHRRDFTPLYQQEDSDNAD